MVAEGCIKLDAQDLMARVGGLPPRTLCIGNFGAPNDYQTLASWLAYLLEFSNFGAHPSFPKFGLSVDGFRRFLKVEKK